MPSSAPSRRPSPEPTNLLNQPLVMFHNTRLTLEDPRVARIEQRGGVEVVFLKPEAADETIASVDAVPAPSEPTPSMPTQIAIASRQQLETDNHDARQRLGLRPRSGVFASTLAGMTDEQIAAENARLAGQIEAKANNDDTDPKPKRAATAEPPKPGGRIEMIADTESSHAKEALTKPLNLSERCRIANGEREEDVRRDRLPKNVVGCVAKPGSLTARVFAAKGLDTSKPQAVSRV